MLLSDDLRERIKKADAQLEMMKGAGWIYFLNDFVHPMGEKAFQQWKEVPAEKTIQIAELQMLAKFSDSVARYADQLTKDLSVWMDELKLLMDGEEEDQEIRTD